MATFIQRRVRSAPGISQEEALETLQSHANYRRGTKIASFRRRGDRWVADLLIPKTAGDDEGGESEAPPKKAPPKDDGDGDDDGDDMDDLGGGPPGLDGLDGGPEGPPGEGGGPKGEEAIVHLLTEILHALKGGPAGPGLGGPDDMGPPPGGPMGGPPPHGGHGLPPAGGPPGMGGGMGGPPKPGGMGIGAKLKPGEVPNKPGVVMPGQPAFSHANPLVQRIASVAGRQRHIPVSSPVGMSVKQAKTQLDPIAEHFGYHVAQVRYCGPSCSCKTPGSAKVHALLEHN